MYIQKKKKTNNKTHPNLSVRRRVTVMKISARLLRESNAREQRGRAH
jgi:hypothetical protein